MQKIEKIVLALSVLVFFSCKKDPSTNEHDGHNHSHSAPVSTNNINFNITNVAGNSLLALNTQTYINENLDTFSVNVFKYYISNIRLFRQDGYIFNEPESYRLLNQSDTTSCKFTIKNVPLGNYIGMQFTIGVDSLRNCDGAQTGALDPVHDMFWDWSQGYIFAKMEGLCNKGQFGSFFHHIGGFSGQYNALVKSTPSFGTNMIQVTNTGVSKVYLKADILEWFKNPSTIDLSAYSGVGGGKKSSEIAANYADMFSVALIQN
ncbi:MAG: hypothetical protein KA163_13305 [Bacteroidia bacterium]|nr:hypothetical protein [Bacteroidia bacterium]